MADWLLVSDPVAAAAQRVLDAVAAVGPGARLAVAGGSVLPVLGHLRQQLSGALWSSLRLTWVDERCVPQDHPDSTRGQAYRSGVLTVAEPPGCEWPLYQDSESPAEACDRVAAGLAERFGGALDVVLLGLGEDGHIASLFPGRPWNLHPTVFHLPDSPKPPPSRITLALPLLAQAPWGILMAQGSGKRQALRRLYQGDPSLPAAHLEHLSVVTDQDLQTI